MRKLSRLLITFSIISILGLQSIASTHAEFEPPCAHGYRVENDKVFFCNGSEEIEVLAIDVNSLQELDALGIDFARDKDRLYCDGVAIEADPDSFTRIGGTYGHYKDMSSVFFYCSKLENSDPATFQSVDGDTEFNWDKNNVYYQGVILEGIDRNTFEVLDWGYAKDSTNVYFQYKKVSDADSASFETEQSGEDFNQYCAGSAVDARDKNFYYMSGYVAHVNYSPFPLCKRGPELSVPNIEKISFPDVNKNTHYKTAIDWMAQNKIINGYHDGTFRPDVCVNRVELLKMLFETLKIDRSLYQAKLFNDTPEKQWYTPYVIAGRARGTVGGYPDGTFKPDQCVNRVEAIKMSVLEFNGGKTPLPAGSFYLPSDIDQIRASGVANPWWMSYFVSALASNTLGTVHFPRFDTNPSKYNTAYNFGPGEPMTRKEVAEMLYRMKAIKDYNMTYYIGKTMPKNIL